MKALLSGHFRDLPKCPLNRGCPLKRGFTVTVIYRYIKRLCDMGHGKVSAVNI